MLRKLIMSALLTAGAMTAWAGTPTVDGDRTVADAYLTATNSAAGIDTNANEGFGDSAKAESLNAQDDASNLYVFVEGSLHSSNRTFVLVDSDGNAATGVSRFPGGVYGENAALNFLDPSVCGGGWDLVVELQGNGGSPATELSAVVLTYSSAGAVDSENYLGGAALSITQSATIRGATADLKAALITGDAADKGIEIAIPKAWLLNTTFSGSYRLAVLNGNGSNSYWSDSNIPSPASGNIGGSGSASAGNMAALTAPIYNWQVAATNPGVLLSTTAPSPTNLTSIPVTATFSVAVTGFAQADITSVTNCTVSGFAGSGTTYTFNIAPIAAGSFSVRIPAGVANASVGGAANNASAPLTLVYDNVGPSAVVLTSTAPNPTGSNPIKVQARFNEAVHGFTDTDITPTNATVTGFTTITAQTYQFSLVPVANGTVSAAIAAGVVTDVAGNASTATGSISRTYNASQTDPVSQFNGNDIYATGGNPPLDGFNPGSNPFLQLRDTGLLGDTAAGDGIFSVNVTPDNGNGTDRRQWKAGNPGWTYSYPSGSDNMYWRPLAGQATKLIFDTRDLNDGYTPEVGGAVSAILYTNPAPYGVGDTIRVTGDMISELGGSDWSAGDNTGLMVDDGTNSDTTAGDGIYTIALAGLPVGAWNFKITFNGSFDGAIGANGGYRDGGDGGNIPFSTFATTDTVKVLFDVSRGAYKITNTNPLANPGPPFFATSASWGTALDASTQLNDAGLNGDVTAGDGVYARTFQVANAATTHTVKVRQYVGATYPNTGGGYPFITSFPGQLVLVQFDTNVRADGFSPSTRYVWTDGNSRRRPAYVQAVGNFQSDFTTGIIGNYSNDAAVFQLFDDGTQGDVTGNDGIYARTFSNLARANSEFKALGSQASWTYQYGGEGDGATYNGNNPATLFSLPENVKLVVDSVTGRVGITSLPTRPASIDALPQAPNAARNWSAFE